MRAESNAKKDFTTGIVCTAPWRVLKVKPLANYQLEVQFVDGTQGIVDMIKQIMSNKAGVFAQLKNQDLFNQVYIAIGVVTWPGEIDLAPDAMYQAIKQSGKWILN